MYIKNVQGKSKQQHVLQISATSNRYVRQIDEAIKGIRAAVKHAKARAFAEQALYIVRTPTASAMRVFVGPQEIETMMVTNKKGVETLKKVSCTGTKCVGDKLSDAEKKGWSSKRKAMERNNFERFQEHLSTCLMEFAPWMGKMRMRLHFGHIILTKFVRDYTNSEQVFDQFVTMMERDDMSNGGGSLNKM